MKRTLASLDGSRLDGQRALVRVDFNVPLKDGAVSDDTRIRASLPTIKYLRAKGARVVLLSHLGRPKGGPDPKYSLKPLLRPLEKLLGAPVGFIEEPDSEAAVAFTRRMPRGSLALAENTRFFPGEETNEVELARRFAARLGGELAQVEGIALQPLLERLGGGAARVSVLAEEVVDGPEFPGLPLLRQLLRGQLHVVLIVALRPLGTYRG
jgi:3-phosphoglycerate kinase